MKNKILMLIDGAAIMGFIICFIDQLLTARIWSLVLFIICFAWIFLFHTLNDVGGYIHGNLANEKLVAATVSRSKVARTGVTHGSESGNSYLQVDEEAAEEKRTC